MAMPPITLVTRLSFGAGAVANGIKTASFTTYLMLYYNQVIGVSAAIVSLAVAATLVV
ncbi:MAG: MFS transporter [Sphingomonas sp.]|uniref:MFS transporter n=1 Tax=Sphingomonas sp. TaxID=28214 RepID=UPI0035A90638|nr:MFS transporter [Sphingomonas sp.]